MIQLMNHQRKLLDLAASGVDRLGIGWEPGLGKTIGVLAVIDAAKRNGFIGSTTVVAPKSILWSAWARDAEHFPELKTTVCWADSAGQRRKLIAEKSDIYILNYEAFKAHQDDLLEAGVRRLVIDESSKLKDPTSQISKAAFEFSKQMQSVYLLSGTPAPNSPHEYFGQIRCINPSIFGLSYYRFLNTYFQPQQRFVNGKVRTVGWRMPPQAKAGFLSNLQKAWWTLRAQDCLDLPPETDVIRDVVLGKEAECYVNLMQELRHEWSDGEETTVAANTKTMKMRQVVGGNLYQADDRRIVGSSKLDALTELLDELGHAPVVVWAEFKAEIYRIAQELLTKSKRPFGIIDGGTPARERATRIAEFQDGKLQYLICHPAAAGHGITLTAAHYDVFYSLSFSMEQHEQARKRIHRVGQHWPVTHYYLIAPGTIDVRILRVLRGKGRASEEIKAMLCEEPGVEIKSKKRERKTVGAT